MSAETGMRAAPRFEASYAPLRPERLPLGEIAVLPWDGEIFGFCVADYRPGPLAAQSGSAAVLRQDLEVWAQLHGAELVGCRVPAESPAAAAALVEAGFRFVELQMRATLPRLDPRRLDPCRLSIRTAVPEDHAPIGEIAGRSFRFGRYHADPFFPAELAGRRFRIWIERALANPSPGTWIGAVGPPGQPAGFVHAERDGDLADIRLVAADPEKAGPAGPALLVGALQVLAADGATRVTAQLSAANSAALNMYASARFQFHQPEVVLHWSRPGAPHMRPSATPDRK